MFLVRIQIKFLFCEKNLPAYFKKTLAINPTKKINEILK